MKDIWIECEEENRIRVYWYNHCRVGCKPVMGKKYFKYWENAMKYARTLANGTNRIVLVEDFHGRCETVEPN